MAIENVIQAAKDGDAATLGRLVDETPELLNARSASGETPLMAALYRGHRGCVEALVDRGVRLDLFAAAALGDGEALDRELSGHPAAVSSFAYDGWTPLHLAAFFGQLAAVERLLDAGADINALSRNSLKNMPLHAGVAGGHVDVALRLIERGASVQAADAGGHTPLHIAAEGGYVPVVKALVERGADPHAVDAEDRTPLARAAARNHAEVVDLINSVGSRQ